MSTSFQTSTAHDANTSRRSFPLPSASGLNAEQLSKWRAMINLSRHPIAVFDQNLRPALFNEALRVKLADPTAVEGTDQPAAFLWQKVCDTAGRLIAEAQAAGETEIADVFPIQQRFFSVVGSILRNPAGQMVGAMINLGDATNSSARISVSGRTGEDGLSPEGTHEDEQAYEKWTARRNVARQRMGKLSRRESQVVALVSDGLPNKSIARALDISVKTIEKHRANATRKLGVGSTAEMVRIAVVADEKQPIVETSADSHIAETPGIPALPPTRPTYLPPQ